MYTVLCICIYCIYYFIYRQEAYEIAAARQRKVDEYRLEKINYELKLKEERVKAIEEGHQTLAYMNNLMKDIMKRARASIREGVKKLQSMDDFSPEAVRVLTEQITNEMLLPM